MSLLPPGFETLEPFVAAWAIEGSAARAAQRGASSEADRQAFYAAAAPRLTEALAYLDKTPMAQHSPAEQNLMNLLLSLSHVSLAVEVQRDHEPRLAKLAPHMPITRSMADL